MTTRRKKKPAAPGKDGFSLITNEKLLALYAAMLRCRMLERHARKLAGPGRTTAFGAGHEAAVVGAAIDLQARDAVVPARGALSPCLVKGVPLKTICAWLRTNPESAPAGYAPRRAIAPGANLAAQVSAACRAARICRKAKKNNIVVLFLPCAELARSGALATLHTAVAERLPLLVVCASQAGREEFAPRAQACGLPGITVDADDVVAIYRVAFEAIVHARRGHGPTLIECKPWTVAGTRRRASGIRNMENYLARKGLFRAQHRAAVEAAFARELEKAAAAEIHASSARR